MESINPQEQATGVVHDRTNKIMSSSETVTQRGDLIKKETILEEKRFYILTAMIFFIVMGIVMTIFAITFIKDVDTLRNVPDAVWNFLCGTPTDNPITLPLLLTLSILSLAFSGALYAWRWHLGR